MLKKIRWKFIRISMLSLLGVFAALLVGINLIGFLRVSHSADALLELIAENGGSLPEYEQIDSGNLDMPGDLQFTAETPFETRYFVVTSDLDLRITGTQMGKIASLTDAQVRSYAEDVLKSGKTRGYYGSYRFLLSENESGQTLIFLSCSREFSSLRAFVRTTILVALSAYLMVFLLVVLLSKRAIRPAMENAERQKQFITDAGHELKTPLTIIATSADVLAADLGRNEWLDNIQRQSARMTKLVGNLVTLSKLDEAVKHEQTFSLSDAAWDISVPFRVMAEAKGIRYEEQIEEDLQFCGDASAMEQLMTVLLDNAVKYTPEGGWIRFVLRREGKNILMEAGNACHLADELDLERLFDRFYRTDPARSRQSGGFGIGLSVAKAVAQAHGGSIRVRRGEDHASVFFTVTL